jgi:hypothetical protein
MQKTSWEKEEGQRGRRAERKKGREEEGQYFS